LVREEGRSNRILHFAGLTPELATVGGSEPLTHLTAVQNMPCKSGRTRLKYNQMVVRRKESEEALNQLFRALADGTRRDILARSLTETPSVSDLAARYEMSFAAVQKHVAVLERAGLIQKRANGREQLVSTNHARLQRAGELLDHFESIWRQRMAQLDDVLLPKGK
jgi:DNA-binding transcriptional ArsR family regulator